MGATGSQRIVQLHQTSANLLAQAVPVRGGSAA
jgi:hypothetical protein